MSDSSWSPSDMEYFTFFNKYHLILVPDDLKVHLFVLWFDYYSSGFLLAWKKYSDMFLQYTQ